MNNQELMQARQKEQERLRERRDKFDLQVESKDLYGGKAKNNAFELDGDDMFGAYGDEDALENDTGYQRLDNGMVINENTDEAKKQNAAIIKAGAKIAMGKDSSNLYEDMQDSRSISEYYAELFSYAPAILSEAIRNGNTYERFKLSIKFAFSIIHCMALQDVVQKKPIIPISGETYEGLYVMPDGNVNIFMESDYKSHIIKDLVTKKQANQIKPDQETTYIHIEGPKSRFQVYGSLTYNQSWKGNNMIISLLGTINVKFLEINGNNQTISIQLPSYVLANFMQVDNKPQVSLISGNMVLEDKGNQLKSVIFVRGLLKKKGLFQTTFEPNMGKSNKKDEKLIDGIIYKTKAADSATKRPE